MGVLWPSHNVIFLLVVIVLFSVKRLSGMARSIGRSTRFLHADTRGRNGDEADSATLTADQARSRPVIEPVHVVRDQWGGQE